MVKKSVVKKHNFILYKKNDLMMFEQGGREGDTVSQSQWCSLVDVRCEV